MPKSRRPLLEFVCCWIAGSALAVVFGGFRFWLAWTLLLLAGSLLAAALGRSWKQIVLGILALTSAALYWKYNESGNVSSLPEWLNIPASQTADAFVRTAGTITSPPELDGDKVEFKMKIKQIAEGPESLMNAVGATGPDSTESSKSSKSSGSLESLESPEGSQSPEGSANPQSSDSIRWRKTSGEQVLVQVRLAAEQETQIIESWARGQSIELSGTLQLPATARNFGGFDYARYLHYKRIHYIIKVQGAGAVHTKPGPVGIAYLLGYNDRMREAIGRRINDIFGEQNAGYMKGLLIGDTDELNPDVYRGFSTLGLTHILAISGSHVAVNLAVLLWLLRKLRLSREAALTAGLVFLPFYMLVTGLSPSVVRACLMAMIGLYLLRRQRLKDGLNILAATALLMLLWEPYYLLDVSFQLSFAVTAGLIIFVPLLAHWFDFLPKRVSGAAAITLAAQLISFPLTIYYFNQFSLLSLAANFLFVPLVSVIALPVGSAALIAGFIWLPLGSVAAFPVRLTNQWTFAAVAWLEGRSGFMTIWKTPHLWWVCLYYIILYLLLRYGTGAGAKASTAAMAPAASTALAVPKASATSFAPTASMASTASIAPAASFVSTASLASTISTDEAASVVGAVSVVGGASVAGAGSAAADGLIPSAAGAALSVPQTYRDETVPLTPQMNPNRQRDFFRYLQRYLRPYLKRGGISALLLLVLAGLLYVGYQPAYGKRAGYVQFIDVGQGDSILITTPQGRNILVDTGGTVSFRKPSEAWRDRKQPYEVGAKVVVPLLKQRGIHALDAVILTHWDKDHAGGLPAVLENIPVKSLIVNGSQTDTEIFKQIVQLALQKKIPLYFAGQGLALHPDANTELEFLAPLKEDSEAPAEIPFVEEQNAHSVVFLLHMGGKSFLFTGDMNDNVEHAWLKQKQTDPSGGFADHAGDPINYAGESVNSSGSSSDHAGDSANPSGDFTESSSSSAGYPPIDVLKVAHHGSKTSTSQEWLDYWRPGNAVISVGVGNTYGHPNADVVKRLESSGAAVFRTDLMGEVQMKVEHGQITSRHKLQEQRAE